MELGTPAFATAAAALHTVRSAAFHAVVDSGLTQVQVGTCDESPGLVRGHVGNPSSHACAKGGIADLEDRREQVLPLLLQQMLL